MVRAVFKKAGGLMLQQSKEEKIERVRQMIYNTGNIVCLVGIGVTMECGAVNFLHERECYRIEDIYHYSPEEIFSTGFYSAKKEKFFEFYKKEILSLNLTVGESLYAIKELERWGKLKGCVTSNVYGLPEMVGIHNIINMHGNIHENWCVKCGKHFDSDYLKNSKGVPVCDACGSNIRPGVRLYGEMVRNDVITRLADVCQHADVLLVLGTNLYDSMVKNALRYYNGNKLVLITKHEHFTDKKADIVIHDEVNKVLPKIVWQ